MAEISDEELSSIVARVRSEVLQEVQVNEAATFDVAKFNSNAVDLAQIGGDNAWTIGYSTARGSITAGEISSQVDNAWAITYTTALGSVADGLPDLQTPRTRRV
jgi:hypothetical protein